MTKNVKKKELLSRDKFSKPLPKRKTQVFDSMTIPNDSLTIRQLLINHTRGVGVLPSRQGIYTDDEIAPRYRDITEKMYDLDRLKHLQDQAQQEHDLNTHKETGISDAVSVEEQKQPEAE